MPIIAASGSKLFKVFCLVLSLGLAACLRVDAAEPSDPTTPMLGEVGVHIVKQGENLLDLARLYDLGYTELLAANPGVDPWAPSPGTVITLPTAHFVPRGPHRGLVINLGALRIFWYVEGEALPRSFPIGIGQAGHDMKAGQESTVLRKRAHPTWVVPDSIRKEKPWLPAVVPPGPTNPLGEYSLDLALRPYEIHGSDNPDAVGRRVTHGCIRLYPEDIALLFHNVPLGTPVTIVDQPAGLMWIGGDLYLQVLPSKRQVDQLEDQTPLSIDPVPGLEELVRQAAGDQVDRIDWIAVQTAATLRRAVPVRITRNAPLEPLTSPDNLEEAPQ